MLKLELQATKHKRTTIAVVVDFHRIRIWAPMQDEVGVSEK